MSDSQKDFDLLDFTEYTPKVTKLRSRKRPAQSVQDLDKEGNGSQAEPHPTQPLKRPVRSVKDLDDEGNTDMGDRSLRKRPTRQAVKAETKEDAKADSEADIADSDIFDDINGPEVEDSDAEVEESDAEFVPKASNKLNRTVRRLTRKTTSMIPSDVGVCSISDSEGSLSGVDQAVQPRAALDRGLGTNSRPKGTTRQLSRLRLEKPEFKTLQGRLGETSPIRDVPFEVIKTGRIVRNILYPLHDTKCKMAYEKKNDCITVELGGVLFVLYIKAFKIGMTGLFRMIFGELIPLSDPSKSAYKKVASSFNTWYHQKFATVDFRSNW